MLQILQKYRIEDWWISRRFKFAGRHIAYFRGTDKVVYAVAAYCPHIGANLGIGGQLKFNSCIECPFHGWAFNGKTGLWVNSDQLDLKVVSTYTYNNIQNMDSNQKGEYLQKVDEGQIKIKTYTFREIKGMVQIWVHCKSVTPWLNQWLKYAIILIYYEQAQTIDQLLLFKNFLQIGRIFELRLCSCISQ